MEKYDLVGIGAGPANLSLASLLTKAPMLKSVFFDQSNLYKWHPGLQTYQAKLQVSFLEDLVCLADPTNEYSFFELP